MTEKQNLCLSRGPSDQEAVLRTFHPQGPLSPLFAAMVPCLSKRQLETVENCKEIVCMWLCSWWSATVAKQCQTKHGKQAADPSALNNFKPSILLKVSHTILRVLAWSSFHDVRPWRLRGRQEASHKSRQEALIHWVVDGSRLRRRPPSFFHCASCHLGHWKQHLGISPGISGLTTKIMAVPVFCV